MNNLYIPATEKTPEINFKSNGIYTIKGNSYSENVAKFYLPILTWLDAKEFTKTNFKRLDINLNYINTTSIKQLLVLVNKLSDKTSGKLKINWMYEVDDEDMLANGEDLQDLSNLTFTFVQVKSKVKG